MAEHTIDSFKILLNNISHELDEENLRSLLSLSAVPGSLKSRMKDGWMLFDYLMKVNFISKDKLGNLRELLRRMRPKRRDLVSLVDEYIKKEYDTDDLSEVIDNFSDSLEKHLLISMDDSQTACCKFNCECYWRFPSCYVPLIAFVSFLLIFACISWYADVPKITKYLNSHEDREKLGKYVITALFLLLVGLSIAYGRKKWSISRRKLELQIENANCTVQNSNSAGTHGYLSGSSLIRETSKRSGDRQKNMPCSYGSCSGASGMLSDYSTGHGTGEETAAGSMST